jgi:uncharacterized protein (TIGR02600 family)
MKTPPSFIGRQFSRGQSQAGIALVIVLAILVLLSALMVAFMTTVSTERSASQAGSDGSAARTIADSTLNLVMAQIREATGQLPDDTTWASQPGAIRTFSGHLSTSKSSLPDGAYSYGYSPGTNDFVYKLYSADRIKVPSKEYENKDLADEINVIEKWDRTKPKKDHVDLNEPVLSPRRDLGENTVEPRYPIVDPRAKFTNNGETPNNGPNPGIVEGFDAKTKDLSDKELKMPGGAKVPYLPMPVKWLYVFKDGSVGPASEGKDTNPIIGRTAFWTDDESCKLNINTASEGTFWDTPSASSELESGSVSTKAAPLQSSTQSLSLAASQPVRGEYQRYPGHPATTCLSPVLGWLWGVTPITPLRPKASKSYLDFKEAVYRTSPFLPFGPVTSMGGTRNPDEFVSDAVVKPGTAPPQPAELTIETKHLYATPDELLFTPRRTDGSNPLLNDRLTPEGLEKLRFFLTATSRAPELNLYGRPRITIWPVNTDPGFRTKYDELFAFTSTLGGDISQTNSRKFFFQRSDAKSQTNDFGQIPRNQELMKYLKTLTSQPVPGFGGSFASKYSFSDGQGAIERDQILTEIFDYIRATNIVDTGNRRGGVAGYRTYTPFYGGSQAGYNAPTDRSWDWSGQVTPIKIGSTMGLGRFPLVTEVALLFTAAGPVPKENVGADKKQTQMEATLLLEMSTPMPGFPILRETYWTSVQATQPGIISFPSGAGSDQPLNLCNKEKPLINIPNASSHEVADGRGYMPTLGTATNFHYYDEHPKPTIPENAPNAAASNRNTSTALKIKTFTNQNGASKNYARKQTVLFYPYISDKIDLAPNGNRETSFKMSQTEFEIKIYAGEAPDDTRGGRVPEDPVQILHVKFPEVTLPVPEGVSGLDVSLQKRFQAASAGNNASTAEANPPVPGASGVWIRNLAATGRDVVRSMELVGGNASPGKLPLNQQGDIRLAAVRPVVPDWFFQPRGPDLYTGGTRILHGLQISHGDPINGYWPPPGTTRGRLALNGVYRAEKPPILPGSLNGVQRQDGGPGDWDRGLSKHMDGAFGDKVDEGNVWFGYTETTISYKLAYYRGRGVEETSSAFFTPNRLLPSAVMFGSLPTGALEGKPWQTLLFRPDREANGTHPGAKIPPDHLMLDLFHIPIVEPYAISEPFSTAGKVNMNYVIAPFGYAKGDEGTTPGTNNKRSYLRRDSALRGVLKTEKLMAVKTNQPEGGHAEETLNVNTHVRFDLNLDKTLQHFETRFKDPSRGLFRSTSEICDVDLYPGTVGNGPPAPSMSNWSTFWNNDYAQTGDNMRERPYAHIYPRLTTKSNVFTVHMRCQTIRKSPRSKPDEFDEDHDQVVGEYRGSATIERFVDPNDVKLKNYNELTTKVDPYYRFRVIATKHFAPR